MADININIGSDEFFKLMNKILDGFYKAVSTPFQPVAAKLLAKAEKIRQISENETKNEIIKRNLEFMKDLLDHYSPRDIRNLINLHDVLAFAFANVKPIKSDAPLDMDWMAQFVDYAKDVSDDEIKVIWGKILADEASEPHTYFKRTLSVLKNIEKNEAEWFTDMLAYSLDYCFPTMFVNEFGYNKIQSLQDCGLLNSSEAGYNINIEGKMQHIIVKGKSLKINMRTKDDNLQTIIIKSVHTLTDAGIQLSRIIDVESNRLAFEKLVERLRRDYPSVDFSLSELKQ